MDIGIAGGAIDGEVVVLAIPYDAAASIVQQYGDQLAGKIVVDIINPVDFSTMSPAVAPGTSGAEEIAKAAPAGTKVIKAFNTTFAGTLVAGRLPDSHSMYSSPATMPMPKPWSAGWSNRVDGFPNHCQAADAVTSGAGTVKPPRETVLLRYDGA